MKKLIVALMATFLMGVCACGNSDEKVETVASTPADWNGTWVFAINGKPSDAFDEFKAVIADGTIEVKQGETTLWAGTFNTDMPTRDTFVVMSKRDPNANLPYAGSNDHLAFPYANGVLTYTEDDNSIEFVKDS